MSLVLTIWDVQHGSSSHLQLPNGGYVVIDLGVGDISESVATFSPLDVLRQTGARIDEVVITHPHRDHLDDIVRWDFVSPGVLRRPRHLTEQEIRAGNKPGDSAILDKYFEVDRRYTGSVAQQSNPEEPTVNGGVNFAFFQPIGAARTNLNNHSIVTFARYAGTTFCIPGDNEAPSWRELLQNQNFIAWLRATNILVAAHHGREAGYCEDVFQHCRPRLVVVSDGPASDTSAVQKYCQKVSGWNVRSRSTGRTEDRQVVTTRCDGTIQFTAWAEQSTNYLDVSVE